MFYSETLLSKTGPLARVWLAANLERKLSKSNVLDSNIESHVSAIVDQGTAPLALRLSGQLLLGVVRIYSRKARYLLDDCNEAIFKIKMAFRPGNVDLPAESHKANATSLILPDAITEIDLLAPMPEPSFLFNDLEEPQFGRDPTLLDFGSSQRLSSSIERARRASTEPSALLPDLNLGLDIGESFVSRLSRERSIEAGRGAPLSRNAEEDLADTSGLYDGPDLDLDFGESELPIQRHQSPLPSILEEDMPMAGMEDDFNIAQAGDNIQTGSAALRRRDQRQSESPLSDVRASAERDLEHSFRPQLEASLYEQDEASVHHAQRAKRRKILQADTETEMHSTQIRAMQNDRSKILKPAQFLPRDPVLLALMEMQRNGNFVSSILGDGRQRGLAPELRGILSLEVVRRSADLKRKREAGILETSSPGPQIQIPSDDEELDRAGAAFDFGADTTLTAPPAFDEDGMGGPQMDDGEVLPRSRAGTHEPSPLELPEDDPTVYNDNFDETMAPVLHPADSGPVSVGTKHAVQLLRERFGEDAASTSTPSKRTKASVLFQDMLPEATTTRAEATKMFFEVLVLATKDAVKVEQESEEIGGPLRLRGKRGLWGSWADQTGAGTQEMAAGEAVTA